MRYNPSTWEQKLYLTFVILGRISKNLALIVYHFSLMKYYQFNQWLQKKYKRLHYRLFSSWVR